jgi:hypothetical protein
MRLHVLYDRSGTILAAVQLDDEKGGEQQVPPLRPLAQRGQFTADFVLPSDFRHLSFFEVCTQLKVAGRGERATLIAKPASRRRAVKRPR